MAITIASKMYNRGKYLFATGNDWTSMDVRCFLVKSTFTFNPDHNFVSEVSTHQAAQTGGTGRLPLAGESVNLFTGGNYVDATDTVTDGTINSGQNITGIVLYKYNASDAAAELICFRGISTTAGDATTWTIHWPAPQYGIFTLAGVRTYNRGGYLLLTGLNLTSADIRITLLKTSYGFNAGHDFLSDITLNGHEASGGGSTTGTRTALASKTVTENDTADLAYFDAADTTTAAVVDIGQTIGSLAIYKYNASDSAAELIVWLDLPNTAGTGSAWTIQWSAPNTAIIKII